MHPRLLLLLVLLLLLLVLPEKQVQAQGTGFVGCDEIVQIPIEECNALELFSIAPWATVGFEMMVGYVQISPVAGMGSYAIQKSGPVM